jgi:hypothetical protein
MWSGFGILEVSCGGSSNVREATGPMSQNLVKAEAPSPIARMTAEQRSLLLGMQTTHPTKITICFRQRAGRWSGGVFLVGSCRRFFPRTMQSLWRRGLVAYHERLGGDRVYSLTQQGFTTLPG